MDNQKTDNWWSPRSRVAGIEVWVLATMGVVCALVVGFVSLAEEVFEGETGSFDEAVLLMLRNPADKADPLGPVWLEEMGRDFTALGSTGVIFLLTLLSVAYLLLRGSRSAALLMAISVGAGQILSSLLKYGLARPRPDLVPHGSVVYTSSFPSGHSMMSAIVFLTLAVLLARHEKRPAVSVFFMVTAISLTMAVGVSRVYLGVHWPTDVLAGWAIGAAWAISCWLASLYLAR